MDSDEYDSDIDFTGVGRNVTSEGRQYLRYFNHDMILENISNKMSEHKICKPFTAKKKEIIFDAVKEDLRVCVATRVGENKKTCDKVMRGIVYTIIEMILLINKRMKVKPSGSDGDGGLTIWDRTQFLFHFGEYVDVHPVSSANCEEEEIRGEQIKQGRTDKAGNLWDNLKQNAEKESTAKQSHKGKEKATTSKADAKKTMQGEPVIRVNNANRGSLPEHDPTAVIRINHHNTVGVVDTEESTEESTAIIIEGELTEGPTASHKTTDEHTEESTAIIITVQDEPTEGPTATEKPTDERTATSHSHRSGTTLSSSTREKRCIKDLKRRKLSSVGILNVARKAVEAALDSNQRIERTLEKIERLTTNDKFDNMGQLIGQLVSTNFQDITEQARVFGEIMEDMRKDVENHRQLQHRQNDNQNCA